MSYFKLYNEVVADPKVQRLSDELFKAWINLLCICSSTNGQLPSINDIAFSLHIRLKKATRIVSALIEAGLFEDCQGIVKPHHWNERQFKGSLSTERVKRCRERSNETHETPFQPFHVTVSQTFHDRFPPPPFPLLPLADRETPSSPLSPLPIPLCLFKDEETSPQKPNGSRYPVDFETFWKRYPRKVGKGQALRAWNAACKRASLGEIEAGFSRALASINGADREFIPHLSTWLNGDRWLDESAPKIDTSNF